MSSSRSIAAARNRRAGDPPSTNNRPGTSINSQPAFSSQTKSQTQSLPGVFIADIDGRWQIPNQGEDGKLLGGVVCEGGYIGSPLIQEQVISLAQQMIDETIHLSKLHNFKKKRVLKDMRTSLVFTFSC
jgi:hypothetical protein